MKNTAFDRKWARLWVLGLSGLALTACNGPTLDWDLRNGQNGFSTADAAQQAAQPRPQPDNRGVIAYPGYQVVVAQRGDTVAAVARRVGLDPAALARHNALEQDVLLRGGEVLALPGRVAEPSRETGARPGPNDRIDITTLAGDAINRAEGTATPAAATPVVQAGPEPVRHQVQRGETAFIIARQYNVTTRSLAEWNGLDAEMRVREGQFLLIPVASGQAPRTVNPAPTPMPGAGSPTPTPPSASTPLPRNEAPATERAAQTAAATPPAPDLSTQRTEASAPRLAMPVQGRIIRAYNKGRNDGIGIAASAGTEVKAAAAGTVAAITRDTDGVTIVVVRHENNLLTVYANMDNIRVENNARVTRGQTLGAVRAGDPSFLHFEVREGFESVDPMPFLQ